MPSGIGYPPNIGDVVKKGHTPSTAPGSEKDLLKFLMASFSLWARTTQTAREKFKRDFEYAEGNGKQWKREDRYKVQRSNRPALEFNQIYPQVELVSGIHRSTEMDFAAWPKGGEDRRLGEIVSGALKAAGDFVRQPRIDARVFDDGTICGLGCWRVTHTTDDVEDSTWGEIDLRRINPLTFIWDPWASQDFGFQDGAFCGDMSWMDMDTFQKRYPRFPHLKNPGEWLDQAGRFIGDSSLFGLGENLRAELFDRETGRIRVLTLWYKVPTIIKLLVNTETGQVELFDTENEALRAKTQLADQLGQEAVSRIQIMNAGSFTSLIDPQGGIENFATPEAAQARLGQISELAGMQAFETFKVVKREARVPHWAELVWGQILEHGVTPYADRNYPYVPYVSRQLMDDPESIFGIVRNLWDPQDEFNKRYSNLLAHANSSSHSGWLNPSSGGAKTGDLEKIGSKPGAVVEFSSRAPQQIKPVEMSSGHFGMINISAQQILRISGVNAEMVGSTTQKTVSGRAIRARQEGGTTILKPRLFNFEEAKLDLAYMLLSRIQQYYPPEKLRRIIGLSELSGAQATGQASVFMDPVSGQFMSDDQIYAMLSSLPNLKFDLAIKLQPSSPTERQAQFERAVGLAGLITSTGRPLGANTMQALIEMSDMPSRLAEGLKRDAEQEQQFQTGEGGQDQAVNQLLNGLRGGRAGGGEGVTGGTQSVS